MIDPSRAAASLLGAVVVLISLQDAFEVVLLPRRVFRRWRLMRAFFVVTWCAWGAVGRRMPVGPKREDYLSIYGPLSMVLLFAFWASGLIVGFGLMQWGTDAGPPADGSTTLASRMLMSGDAFFTLGYGDVVPRTALSRILVILEAGVGFGFVALTIGYLPVLHQHFSDRDTQLIRLDARAGTPASGATMLLRFATEADRGSLDAWLAEWELWAARLIESHTSYPMLAFYRSQHRGHSWLASLAMILDCCVLLIASGRPPHLQASATFAAARRVLSEIGGSLHIAVRGTTEAGRFPSAAQIGDLAVALSSAGCTWDVDHSRVELMAALRATYEPLLERLSSYLLLPVVPWRDLDPESSTTDDRSSLIRRLTRDPAG
ncbi:potassium channel family protein [Lichenibacterium dinghuense]|uniref:potassium channel family protein n=1 Tax=Lichenibacterium dinghuense TaxID=2895977 RepID=UPI001F1B1D1A|nr:potassium channel family protein [Lichenibacterium sp. 6Y81]